MAPTASTLYKQQSRYKGKLTREYASTGLGTIYWSSTQTLGITAGWFEIDAENTKGEELFITGITGTTSEYSGTVSIRGLRDYGADTNVPAKQYVHRVTSSIIVSDNHSWTDQMITAFLAHEQLAGAFHGFAGIGTDAARPAAAAGNTGMLYYSTDGLVMYYSDGATWHAPSAGTQPDSTTAIKGVVKMSVAPVSAASPIAVGDNDTRLTTAGNMTDLTDGGDSTLHYHATDRARANHTGTQTFSTIADSGTAGETLAANDLVYFKSSDSKYWKAVDGTDSWNATHVVYTGGAANDTVVLLPLTGRLTLSSNLTANTTYYRSSTGTLTSTKPVINSSSIVPLLIGTTDAAGNLVCNKQRLQRIKVYTLVAADLASTPTTLSVGFNIGFVKSESYYRDNTTSPYSYQVSNGYYDVAGAEQKSSMQGLMNDRIVVIQTGSGAYYSILASVTGGTTLSLALSSTSFPRYSLVLTVYEAL